MNGERAYWLAWSGITGIGPVTLKRVYQHFGSLEAAWSADASALATVAGMGADLVAKVVVARARTDPERLLNEHLVNNPHFWTPDDPDYPRLLREIPSPPPLLYYRGRVDLRENRGQLPAIAIVGTRDPTDHGTRWTRRLSASLARGGFAIVSGMAAGVDGAAHQSCLRAGGRTIAVLGTGVDLVYPSHHRALYGEISERGLVVSEYPAGTPPRRAYFPLRNRIIAGLSRATIVVEAPERSGSLITARYANEFGGDVYVLPNSPDVFAARGCLKLIRDGAEIILSEDELLETLSSLPGVDSSPSPATREAPLAIEPRLGAVYRLFGDEPLAFDTIVSAARLPSPEVAGILLELELMELVTQLPGMRYRRLEKR